jgi:hypothetical protein
MPEIGPLNAFSDVEAGVLGLYRNWMHTWLLVREAQQNLAYGTIARPRSYLVKQTFTALPGEEQTPCVIAVSDGFSEQPERRGTGIYDTYFRFGIAVVCMANGAISARAMAGHYQSVIMGIALAHRTVDEDGNIKMCDFVNLRMEDIDEEVIARSMAAARLELVYCVNGFAAESPTPDYVPDDELPGPVPPDAIVEQVFVDVESYHPGEEFPEDAPVP